MNQQSVSSQEQSEQFLQPISRIHPANEIISKKYAPDQKPPLRLIKPEQSIIISQTVVKKYYEDIFDEDDTLGYCYSLELQNNTVYSKMNNLNYMKYKIGNKSCRFVAGVFIPADKLLAPEVKINKNIYKNLPDLQAIQYKSNTLQEYINNCKTNVSDIKFSSDLESGNLLIAMKKTQYNYELILQNDLNSKGNTQWFNFIVDFKMQGMYTFKILNFTKSYSQYQDGMKILCYCLEDDCEYKYTKIGESIVYEQSNVKRQDCENRYYYTLKFQYLCPHAQKVQFSYFYPYISLDLQKFLKKILYRKINVHMNMRKIKVCQTISGLPIYVIYIHHKKNHKNDIASNSNYQDSINTAKTGKKNKSVVFMARQHSGQTQGSYISEGIIDLLMENSEIDYLKNNIDFYVFPMINVDGVYYGNYRTNASGTDLNRIWRNPSKDLHPEVYYIKKYLHQINLNSPISLIIDLHGHSKSLNSFFYGNPPRKDILSGITQDTRLFPYVCSKKIKQISFEKCTFSISEAKKNSARVVLSQCFPRALVYTLENSFQGWERHSGKIYDYTQDSLRKIGREVTQTYLEYNRLIEKNPQVREKWLKQIMELKIRSSGLSANPDNGESDSQAQQQLIDISQSCTKELCNNQIQMSLYKLKSCRALQKNRKSLNMQTNNISSYQKQKTYRNISNKINKYTQYYRNFVSINQTVKKQCKQNSIEDIPQDGLIVRQQDTVKSQAGQGFLSIFKIKTCDSIKSQNKDINSSNNCGEKALKSTETGRSSLKLAKDMAIEALKNNFKIQDTVNHGSSNKKFLNTKGIPLKSKFYY